MKNRKRRVSYDGDTCTVRSDKIEIPDFDQMDRFAVLIWLNKHTYATGTGIRTKPNLLRLIVKVRGIRSHFHTPSMV